MSMLLPFKYLLFIFICIYELKSKYVAIHKLYYDLKLG